MEQRRGARVRRDSGRDPLDVIDYRIAEAVALTHMVSTGDCVRDLRFHGPSFNVQLHFDLLVSTKLLTELTTLLASSPTAAIWLAEGLDGSALTALGSVSTDVFTALVSVGKSLLAELTSDVASLSIVLTCDVSPLIPLLEAELGRFLTEFSRLGAIRAVRRLAAATTCQRNERDGRDQRDRHAHQHGPGTVSCLSPAHFVQRCVRHGRLLDC